jgi:hypothetical protein
MNELLLWASAVGSGTEASFKRKATELLPARRAGPAAHRRALWNLGSLAHCEFRDAADRGWRVAPPVLAAGDPIGPVSAVLCGARSGPLLARLNAAAEDSVSVRAQRDAPDLIEVRKGAAADLISISRDVGIPIQWNAPIAILAAFEAPSMGSYAETALPSGGWTVERFSRSGMNWVASSVADAGRKHRGLFRFKSDYDIRHVFRNGGITREVPPGIAKYWILGRRQRAMRINLSHGIASFPLAVRPPGLIDRALVVASGTLPTVSDRRLTYSGITAPVATAVAAALRAIGDGAD